MTAARAQRRLSQVMMRIAVLCEALEVHDIKSLPGCWVYQVDEHWTIAVNGHPGPVKYGVVDVPAFHAYVEFNGFPAGFVNAYSGTMAAGEAANEDLLIAAINRAITQAREERKKGE